MAWTPPSVKTLSASCGPLLHATSSPWFSCVRAELRLDQAVEGSEVVARCSSAASKRPRETGAASLTRKLLLMARGPHSRGFRFNGLIKLREKEKRKVK